MIYSMTAFGRVQKEEAGYCLSVEIKTINSRQLDVVLRFPRNYPDLEPIVRKKLSQSLRRGRVEVYAQVETSSPDQKAPRLNMTLARSYWEALRELHYQLPGSDPPMLAHLLQFPNLFETGEEPTNREVVDELLISAVDEALQQIHEMRAREGRVLFEDCSGRMAILRQELSWIEGRKELIVKEYQERLRKKVQELLKDTDVEIDPNRFLQEVAFIAERSDITEEIVRIQSHLEQMEASLLSEEPAEGRKLDFLTQELHREVNTIGSKAGDLEIAQSVVRMKSEIGKLREQIQNVE